MQGQGSVLYFQPSSATPSERLFDAAHRERHRRFEAAARKLVSEVESPPVAEEVRTPETPAEWAARQVAIFQPTKEPWFVIEEEIEPVERRSPSIDEIQRAVAAHFGVTRDDILSVRRTLAVVRPRQVAIYLSRRMTRRSMPEIGRKFGDRDHTTVLHAMRKIGELIDSGAPIARDVSEIHAKIDGAL